VRVAEVLLRRREPDRSLVMHGDLRQASHPGSPFPVLDVVVERLRKLEERLELGASAETLQLPFGGVPLDADGELLGLVDAAGGLPALAVR
jgi:hypothetical protein